MNTTHLPPSLERWIERDPDPETVKALISLYQADPAEAERLFAGRIGFGTAGLRAVMGPGPNRMNRVVVRQATAGLLSWLRERCDTPRPTVLVGFDARHNSKVFAADVAREVADSGGIALLFDEPTATPIVAYETLRLAADAAIVITASHNPPADNGYKLYLDDGIQLVPPADRQIAAAIDEIAELHMAAGDAERDRSVVDCVGRGQPGGVIEAHSAAEATVAHRLMAVATLGEGSRQVSTLYSAMHGVGGRAVVDAMVEAGFPTPAVVAQQFDPDPEFPTTPFPNPEEPGALDLAFQTADEAAAQPEVILANDPDADRLAVAVPVADGWRRLTGDEVGVLLADHLLRRHGETNGRPGVVASSIVSSRFIDLLARHHGAESIRTLTGFKWVARPIVDRPDADYVMGYEEALGYCVNPAVRDKDGITAALVMAEIAAECRRQGLTLVDRLDELSGQLGLYATSQVSIGFGHLGVDEQQSLAERVAVFSPEELAGVAVVSVEFLEQGRRFPPTAGVIVDLADASRVIVRPSGTEPKVKIYLEVTSGDRAFTDLAEEKEKAKNRLAQLEEAVTRSLVG